MTRPFANDEDHAAGAPRSGAAVAAVTCGTRVTVRRGIVVSDLWIVEETAAQPKRRRIGPSAPLARALIGARVGDAVEYRSGGHVEDIRILAVRAEG